MAQDSMARIGKEVNLILEKLRIDILTLRGAKVSKKALVKFAVEHIERCKNARKEMARFFEQQV